jgi:hypothetical protein
MRSCYQIQRNSHLQYIKDITLNKYIVKTYEILTQPLHVAILEHSREIPAH